MNSELQAECEALETKRAGIGRPRFGLSPQAVRAREEWDAAHPDLVDEYTRIAERLHQLRQEEEAERATEEREKALWDGLARTVGERNASVLRAGVKPTKAVEGVYQREREGRTFLLLCGAAGAGKSIAAALAVERYLRACQAKWGVPRPVFARAVECTRLSLFTREDVEHVKAMRDAGLFVIDDLGAESHHATWQQTLEDVIDARYQRQRPTVLTTNLDAAAFKERYGERIADRIRHDGLVVGCGAESMRGRAEGTKRTQGGGP